MDQLKLTLGGTVHTCKQALASGHRKHAFDSSAQTISPQKARKARTGAPVATKSVSQRPAAILPYNNTYTGCFPRHVLTGLAGRTYVRKYDQPESYGPSAKCNCLPAPRASLSPIHAPAATNTARRNTLLWRWKGALSAAPAPTASSTEPACKRDGALCAAMQANRNPRNPHAFHFAGPMQTRSTTSWLSQTPHTACMSGPDMAL